MGFDMTLLPVATVLGSRYFSDCVKGFTPFCLTWAAFSGDGLCRNFALDFTRGVSQQGEMRGSE